MKDFNDFAKYLTESIESEKIVFPELSSIYMLSDTTSENISAFMQNYSDDILRAASMIAIQYLRAYHEWLQAQSE